jgi:AraC-like DNA-binding protein
MVPHTLLNWEFMVVTKGRCGVILYPWETLPLRKNCLWIFPPGYEHGWHGDQAGCEVFSFHVEEVPVQLLSAIKETGFLEIELSPAQLEEIVEMGNIIHPDFYVRDLVNELRFDRAIVQMSLTALGAVPAMAAEITRKRAERIIHNAVVSFRSNLTEPPAVRWRKMTKAAGVSSAKLRGFFVSVLNKTAHQVMTDIRIVVATDLLENTRMKLDSIAAEAGFGSYRAFARDFASRKGCCPLVWRLKVRAMVPELAGRNEGEMTELCKTG